MGPAGTEVSLDSLRGSTVVVNFWASWCPPCSDETPMLDTVADALPEAGPERRGRGRRRAGPAGEGARLRPHDGVAYPLLRDGTDGAKRAFQVPRLPESFVIDPSGRIALHVIGPVVDPAPDHHRRGPAVIRRAAAIALILLAVLPAWPRP